MTAVLVCGAYHRGEIGLDAQLAAFAQGLSDVAVRATAPPRLAERLGVESVNRSAWALERAIARSDVVLVGGGPALEDVSEPGGVSPLAMTALVVAAARARRRRVAIVDVGASTPRRPRSRAILHGLVRTSQLLVLRDGESALALAASGARPPFRVAADAAWSALGWCEPRPGRAGVTVALDSSCTAVPFFSDVARLVELVARQRPVRLQPWHERDVALAYRLAAAARRSSVAPLEVVTPPATLHDAVRAFAADELVVSMRYHATMAAAAAGVPSLSIGHRPAICAVARRIGHPVLGCATASPRHLCGLVQAAIDAPSASAAVTEAHAAAAASFALLRLLVNDGDVDDLATVEGLPLAPAEVLR